MTGRRAATGCRRRRSGKRPRAAGHRVTGSRGAIPTTSITAGPTIVPIRARTPMTRTRPRVVIRPIPTAGRPTPARRACSGPTGTGCATWRATRRNTAGTGIPRGTIRYRRGPIRAGRPTAGRLPKRVHRGGGYSAAAPDNRVARRRSLEPGSAGDSSVGFRTRAEILAFGVEHAAGYRRGQRRESDAG